MLSPSAAVFDMKGCHRSVFPPDQGVAVQEDKSLANRSACVLEVVIGRIVAKIFICMIKGARYSLVQQWHNESMAVCYSGRKLPLQVGNLRLLPSIECFHINSIKLVLKRSLAKFERKGTKSND